MSTTIVVLVLPVQLPALPHIHIGLEPVVVEVDPLHVSRACPGHRHTERRCGLPAAVAPAALQVVSGAAFSFPKAISKRVLTGCSLRQ
jgi:hypothetical protein